MIRFYESEAGRRFLTFQDRLAAASGKGMGPLISGQGALGQQTVAPDVLGARMELLRLSKSFAMFFMLDSPGGSSKGMGSGAAGVAIGMQIAALSQGEALDRIRSEYSAELPSFTAFVQSPAEAHELQALFDATAAATDAIGKVLMEVSPEVNGDVEKWREMYQALPAS